MFYRRYSSLYFGMSKGELEKSRCQTVWMGGIPKRTKESEILEFFEDYNPIDCNIIEKSKTNRFAFIYFSNELDRDNAITGKKNCLFKGEKVVVNRSFNAYEGPRIGGKERIDESGRSKKY